MTRLDPQNAEDRSKVWRAWVGDETPSEIAALAHRNGETLEECAKWLVDILPALTGVIPEEKPENLAEELLRHLEEEGDPGQETGRGS